MAGKGEIIAAVDFGTYAVRVVIVRRTSDGHTRILGYGAQPTNGSIRFGAVQDLNAALNTFRAALDAARKASGARVYSIYCGIHGDTIKSGIFEGNVEVQNGTVRPEHIEEARANAAQNFFDAGKRPISSVTAEEWNIDGVRVTDPIGLRGAVLKGRVHFAQLPIFIENNLRACVEAQGIAIEEFVFMPLAAAEGCMTCEDMQLGAAVVDLGAAGTGISIYFDGNLIGASSFNCGSGYIISDVSAGLKVSFGEAAELVLDYGINEMDILAMGNRGKKGGGSETTPVPEKADTPIKLKKTVTGAPSTVSRKELDDIIFARSAENTDLIIDFLKKNRYLDCLSRGIILTGGGASILGQDTLMEAKSGLPVRIGVPIGIDDLPEELDLPAWAPVMGIAKFAVAHRQAVKNKHIAPRVAGGNSVLAFIRRLIATYFIEI